MRLARRKAVVSDVKYARGVLLKFQKGLQQSRCALTVGLKDRTLLSSRALFREMISVNEARN